MKHLIFLVLFTTLLTPDLMSQQYRKDIRSKIKTEDGGNVYKSDQISTLDLLRALELSGVSINKVNIGPFTKQYDILIIRDEYKKGDLLTADTMFFESSYPYYVEDDSVRYFDYVDFFKIFTRISDSTFTMSLTANPGQLMSQTFPYKKYDNESKYYVRAFNSTNWQLNEKNPIIIFASSWKDKKWGFQRFCGPMILTKNDVDTKDLLSSSPHYVQYSYVVKEVR